MENYNEENQNDNFGVNNNNPEGSGKGQKFAVGALAIFAIFILFMWSSSLKQSISSPFTYDGQISENSSELNTCEGGDCLFEENLKLKDTDRDGISDWDELNIYNTSPYLEDSDSDGYADREEIQRNQDPNCPVGKECSTFSEVEDIATESSLGQLAPENIGENTQVAPSVETQTIRDLFLESGQFDKEFLDQYTDEQLQEAYQVMLSEQ